MTDLLARAAAYVAIDSISGNEAAFADEVEGALRANEPLEVRRIGDNVVARTTGDLPRRIIVAGHLDTVPGDPGAARVEGSTLTGLGACDMKGSVAAMVALATSGASWASEVTWIFYAREEVAREASGLLELQHEAPELLTGDVALLAEPTGGVVEAGCQGSVRVRLVLKGARAHTARPWRGRNAIHRLAGPISKAASYVPRVVTIGSVTYTEQLQAVGVGGGVGGNVVPDEASVLLNHRVAPDRSAVEGIKWLRGFFEEFLEDSDEFVIEDAADGAPPSLEQPVLARLVALSGAEPRAKLGFTDASTFSAMGIPSANFGAGDPELAHHADERVTSDELSAFYEVMLRLLEEPVS